VTLEVAGGEVVGVAGVVGNGQVALAEAIVGLEPVVSGDATIDGASVVSRGSNIPMPSEDVAYIPERPIDNAVVGDLDLAMNIGLRKLYQQPFFGDDRARLRRADDLLARYDVRPPNAVLPASALSGGNLQKLVIAREFSGTPKLVVSCYPTMGLDLIAANAVRQSMFDHARRGAAVLWFSEDLDELLMYAHRIAVLHGGRLVGVVRREEATRDGIGRMMMGVVEHSHAA
jgi:general nucleoside transport system ATP-binding protein